MLSNKRFFIILIVISVVGILYYLNSLNILFANSKRFNGLSENDRLCSIMTFNLDGSDKEKFTTDFFSSLITLISDEHPDIVCFQELSFENLLKFKPQLDSIYGPCEVLKGDDQMWRLRFYSHYPLKNFKRLKCDGEISPTSFTDEEKAEIELYHKQMNVMSAEFEIEPGKWVTVFSGHLRSSAYSTARRSMNNNDSWLSGLSLYWRNYKVGKRIRDYEAENVRRFIDEARTEGKPVIVAGDLNDWNGSYCLKTLMGKDLKDSWSEGGRGFGWTFFGWGLRLRLDHILYSDELELVDVKVIDSDLSDHKPLVAKFRFKN